MLLRQPLALTLTWKNIDSSKPERSTTLTRSSKWLTSTKTTTKDIQTVYQVASMAPRKSPMEITRTEDQLNYLKSEMSQNKGWEAKLEEVIQMAANAASYKDRSRSLDNKSKSNFKHTTSIQTPSQNRIKVLKDNDELMQDISKSVGSKL
jgi:hypothetical protein